MTPHRFRIEPVEPIDVVAIEREARRLQALAIAAGLRVVFGWLRGRLSNLVGARTA